MAMNFAHAMDGVWSEGTLNPDDISKVMIIIYQRLISLGLAKPNNAVNELKALRTRSVEEDPTLSEENYRWTQEEVDELINNICGEHGYWFGGHPDDPACIGIWKAVEE